MPTLTDAEMDALRAELAGPAYADLTDLERFEALHAATTVPNPVPSAPKVPQPFGYGDIHAILSPASRGGLAGVAFMPRILDDIAAMNRPGIVGWADVLFNGSTITQAEHDAIVALMEATVPDPGWAAEVPGGPSPKGRLYGAKSWARPDGGRVDYIPIEDIEEAR